MLENLTTSQLSAMHVQLCAQHRELFLRLFEADNITPRIEVCGPDWMIITNAMHENHELANEVYAALLASYGRTADA